MEVEDKQVRDYELVLIISPEITEEGYETIMGKISQLVTGSGGVISDVERWGKRRLAYPINHFVEGNYVLTRFKSKPALNRELKVSLQVSEEVLRYLLIRLNS